MAPILSKTEISRPQEEVFAYVSDPSLFAEWRVDAVGGSMKGHGPPRVGSGYVTTRLIGDDVRTTTTSEITESSPSLSPFLADDPAPLFDALGFYLRRSAVGSGSASC